MKRIFIAALLCACIQDLTAQTNYYKTEWTKKDKGELYTGICKITINEQSELKAEIVWTYVAIDSTDNGLMELYKGKKGRSGIEFAEGNFSATTHDIHFEGREKNDPFTILGLDKYALKLSSDGKLIYGTTFADGTNNGLFCAVRLKPSKGARKFAKAEAGVSKK